MSNVRIASPVKFKYGSEAYSKEKPFKGKKRKVNFYFRGLEILNTKKIWLVRQSSGHKVKMKIEPLVQVS